MRKVDCVPGAVPCTPRPYHPGPATDTQCEPIFSSAEDEKPGFPGKELAFFFQEAKHAPRNGGEGVKILGAATASHEM